MPDSTRAATNLTRNFNLAHALLVERNEVIKVGLAQPRVAHWRADFMQDTEHCRLADLALSMAAVVH